MGNFYANITLPLTDIDAVAGALTDLDRVAWLASDGRATVVFDRACDEQDERQLERLAVALSKRLDCAALGAGNHDDDVLLLVLAERGKVTDRYDSNPGYFKGRRDGPEGGSGAALCAAFGADDRIRKVEKVLRTVHADFPLEIDRHRALQSLLGLPETLSFLGYRYVARGELDGDSAAATLRRVGAAGGDTPTAAGGAPSADMASHPALNEPTYERSMAAMQAESPDVFWNAYALMLQDAEVPERSRPIFGVARGNGYMLFERMRSYLISHRLIGHDGWVRADDQLADLVGEREFNQLALGRLLLAALGLQPMTAEQIAAFQRGDPDLLRRIGGAVQEVIRAEDPAFGGGEDDEVE
jgi:hypothetical protein